MNESSKNDSFLENIFIYRFNWSKQTWLINQAFFKLVTRETLLFMIASCTCSYPIPPLHLCYPDCISTPTCVFSFRHQIYCRTYRSIVGSHCRSLGTCTFRGFSKPASIFFSPSGLFGALGPPPRHGYFWSMGNGILVIQCLLFRPLGEVLPPSSSHRGCYLCCWSLGRLSWKVFHCWWEKLILICVSFAFKGRQCKQLLASFPCPCNH